MKNDYPYMKLGFETEKCFGAEALNQIMSYILPPSIFEGEGAEARFLAQLPIISWTPLADPPFDLTFFLCCRFRANAFRFFYEMICRWLIPGKRLNALLQFAADFSIPELGPQKYIGGVVRLRVENARELETIQQHLPIIEQELRLGLESYYQACRILEIKGLSSDEKTALIQENIVSLIHHRPQDFDYDILSEMQHFLVICKEEFKAERTYRHMSRIICVHYLFRRALKLSLESFPERRYVSVKLVRAKLLGKRPILGISIGFSFIRDNELFEERHILSGVQALIPGAKSVTGSFFRHYERSDPICTLYLEIEKEGGLSLKEERLLKEELPSELKNRFEQRLNPIFMPQNEEMVMRNILALSSQLKYVRDLPQTLVDFHQQTEEHLEFLVIMLRIVRPGLPDIATCFENKPTFLEYIPDRKKIVGRVRKKYPKEATVFLLRIRKDPFLRKNQSVDLYKARKKVGVELARLVGEFRDYNGGTISKETELFDKLKEEIGEGASENAFLLENFFYSLTPPVMRSILPVEPIKKLFCMLLEEELIQDQDYTIRIQEDSNYLYALITAADPHFHQALHLDELEEECVSCFVPQTDSYSYGLICLNATPERSLKIRLAIEELMVVN
ncbi:MAG: hypothetical protein S4CHLAM2_01170 [Chlamydiales bacterium]|nr:hypothetical protein [Chlamydiales bacterium]